MAKARVALGQFHATTDKDANLRRMLELHSEAAAAGADLVVFPETAMFTAEDPKVDTVPVAEPLDGPFVSRLREAAAGNGVAIVTGMYESAPPALGKTYNSAVAIGTGGELIGAYRKIHMFDAFGFRESDHNEPGDGELLLFTLAGVRFGVTICYDLRFPELFRELAERGADAILLPTAWMHGRLKELHLAALGRARAIENTVYFAAADQTGGMVSGNSELIDPMGVTVASIGEQEGLAVGTVDTARVAEVRRKVPSLQHVRHDIYATWRRVPEPV
ncbi:MAG: carbon-nitrogen hydrolase family protein [Candidatus Dormibacteraeota bacterium]|nr:carbon-nitrogen hydrolase family protein [Candidatus Dormibacteraeota bacterium]